MSQFSTNEMISLEKSIENITNARKKDIQTIYSIYDVDNCINWIKNNNYKKVCLQFPNHMLPDSSEVAIKIEQAVNQKVYILGDTAYESCCVDYVAAEHVKADALIHFGDSCYSKTETKLPVLKINEKVPMNLSVLCQYVKELDTLVTVVYDQKYEIYKEQICEQIEKVANCPIICSILSYKAEYSKNTTVLIGVEGRTHANFQNFYTIEKLYIYDPTTQIFERYSNESRAFKRRYYLIEKIKDANTVGIVVGTLAVQNYLKIIYRIKKLCQLHGKKSYIFSVGKPNEAKLANFPEVDVFVVIACLINQIYDSREYYKPIVTPYDIEKALNPQSTLTCYNPYDFNEILSSNLPEKVDGVNDPDISMISGKLRLISNISDEPLDTDSTEKTLVVRNDMAVAENIHHGAGYYSARTWKGLEQNLGENEPMEAEKGRCGVPMEYDDENKAK